MSHHKWGDKERPSTSRSLKHCRRCGVICVSRHEVDAHGHAHHWKEYWRGTDRLSTNSVPECVLSIENEEIEEAA